MNEIYKYKDISESALIKSTNGKLKGVVINNHTSGTLKLVDGSYNGAPAVGTLTSSGAMAPADYAVGTLTSTGVNVSDGDTVVCGATGGTSRTYRFKTTPIAAYDVQIGADAATSLANLKAAINATGTAGVEYFAGTLVNPDIIAYTLTATTLKVAFRSYGTAGNSYTTTETAVTLSWGGGTLAGGVATTAATIVVDTITYTVVKTLTETIGLTAVPYQVLWVTSEAVFLDNLKLAINTTGLEGTDYSTGTLVHPTVIATTNTNTAQTVQAKKIGSAGNAIATTEALGNYAWGAATLASGTGATGRVMHDTITFGASERYIDFSNEAFDNALLAVIGGAANITLQYE